MYTARRLWKHEGTMVPHAIADFEDDYLQDWLDWSSTDTDLCLYHYTDAHGMKGIVEEKEIWCSELEYLNDAQEVEYGLDLIRGKVEELQEDHSNDDAVSKGLLGTLSSFLNAFPGAIYRVFVACFCRSGDLLSQWRGYAEEGGGYSLGFTFKDQSRVMLENGNSYRPHLRRVLYDRDRQEKLVDDYLERVCEIISVEADQFPAEENQMVAGSTATHVMNTLMDWIVSFKHPGFKEENEWRLVRMLRSTGEAESQAHFRVADGLTVPYLSTPLVTPFSNSNEELGDYFPLSEIRYGPTLPSDRAESSIESLLVTESDRGDREIAFENISIKSPDVPFRG
jgi:hypothetical protein